MTVKVLLFAVLAARCGRRQVEVVLPEEATVGDLLAALGSQYPPIAALRDRVAVAVNHEYAATAQVLHAGDEIALIPPVSGG